MEREIVQDFERIERLAHVLEGDHRADLRAPAPRRSGLPAHWGAFRQRMARLLTGRRTPNSIAAINTSSTRTQAKSCGVSRKTACSGERMSDTVRGCQHLRQHHGPHGDARSQGEPGDGGRGDARQVDLSEQEPAGEAVDPAHLHQARVDGEDPLDGVHIHGGHHDEGHHEDHREIAQAEPEHGQHGDDDRGDGHAHPA